MQVDSDPVDMRRTFTIQLYDAPPAHNHDCDICCVPFTCGETGCDTDDHVCTTCLWPFECPQCGEDTSEHLIWVSDEGSAPDPVTSHFAIKCPDCGTTASYSRSEDDPDARLICWAPSDPNGPQHIKGPNRRSPIAELPQPRKRTGTVKGTAEYTVTMELAPGSPTIEEFVDAVQTDPKKNHPS